MVRARFLSVGKKAKRVGEAKFCDETRALAVKVLFLFVCFFPSLLIVRSVNTLRWRRFSLRNGKVRTMESEMLNASPRPVANAPFPRGFGAKGFT